MPIFLSLVLVGFVFSLAYAKKASKLSWWEAFKIVTGYYLASLTSLGLGVLGWIYFSWQNDYLYYVISGDDWWLFPLLVMVVMLALLVGGTYLLYSLTHKKRQKELRFSVWLLVSPLAGIILAFAAFLGLLFWSDACNDGVLERANYFNAHIKSLCLERNDGECPADINQLRAFKPLYFDELTDKAKVSYSFDGVEYEFVVGYCGGTRVFSPQFPHGRE